MDKIETPRKLFKVPAENLDLLRTQIDVVNKRVARLQKRGHDVAMVAVNVGELYAVKSPGKIDRIYADVELLSPAPPKVAGWEFVASLTHVDGVGSVLRVCPGAEVSEGELARYREASPENCDHCHTTRKRTDTFVIRDAGGNLSQVGRQCLQAYTGLANPAALCATAEILFAMSELLGESEDDGFGGGFGGGSGQRYVTISCFLPYVCCSIRTEGWLSRTSARDSGHQGQSTCDQAFGRGVYAKPTDRGRYVPEDKDYNLAAATIEFCEQHFADSDVEALSDYESSLRVAMASGIAHPKFAGLIASSVGFYQRDIEKKIRQESWAKIIASSRFQGVVGERGLFEVLKVLAYRTWEGEWGAKHFYSFVDEAGNAYAYFATRDMDLAVGQVVSLRATVKKHEMRTPKHGDATPYAQTLLTRCSLVTRAKVTTVEIAAEWFGKLTKLADQQQSLPLEAGMFIPKRILERCHDYHLEGSDGRRYVCRSKSKKKGVVAGVEVVVTYDPNPVAGPSGEIPVSLVSVA
jgi:hypothetical protein